MKLYEFLIRKLEDIQDIINWNLKNLWGCIFTGRREKYPMPRGSHGYLADNVVTPSSPYRIRRIGLAESQIQLIQHHFGQSFIHPPGFPDVQCTEKLICQLYIV